MATIHNVPFSNACADDGGGGDGRIAEAVMAVTDGAVRPRLKRDFQSRADVGLSARTVERSNDVLNFSDRS